MNEIPKKRKPGRPKGIDSDQTMHKILRTAALLFMEQGFNKVSLADVAHTCGITKASIYYYFSNKGVLFTECILFVLNLAYVQTRKIIHGSGTLQERLIEVAKGHMNNAHVEFETMMREAATGLTEEQVQQIRRNEHALYVILAEEFLKARNNEEIVCGDPALLAHLFVAMLTVKNHKQIINEHKSVEQAAKEMVDMLWIGLSPR